MYMILGMTFRTNVFTLQQHQCLLSAVSLLGLTKTRTSLVETFGPPRLPACKLSLTNSTIILSYHICHSTLLFLSSLLMSFFWRNSQYSFDVNTDTIVNTALMLVLTHKIMAASFNMSQLILSVTIHTHRHINGVFSAPHDLRLNRSSLTHGHINGFIATPHSTATSATHHVLLWQNTVLLTLA